MVATPYSYIVKLLSSRDYSEFKLREKLKEKKFSDNEFSEYVLDSENAMSREHTMWLAQKRM